MLRKVIAIYGDGLRGGRLRQTLWWVIGVKVVVIFVVLKLLFFPAFLGGMAPEERAEYVGGELVGR